MSFLNRHRSLLLRFGLSTGITAFILTQVELERVGSLLASLRLEFIAFSFFFMSVERVFVAYKLKILLAAKRMSLPILRIVKIIYVSNFFGNFLPSSVGIDVLKSFYLYRYGINLAESVSSVLVDKMISLLPALFLPICAALFFPSVFPDETLRRAILLAGIAASCGLMLALNLRFSGFLIAQTTRIHPRFGSKLKSLENAVREYLGHRKSVGSVIAISLVFQLIRVMATYSVALSIGPAIGIVYFLAIIPIIGFLSMLPISLGGLGVREGAFVYFFSRVGITVSDAFTMSLLVYAVMMISALPGGVIYALEGAGRPAPHPDEG